MKFITTAPDRRTLVKAIAAHTGMEPSYVGPPTFNYTVGTIIVDREGYVDVPDEQAADLKAFLIAKGWMEPEPEPEQLRIQIGVPAQEMTVQSVTNLIFMLYSKQYLLGKAVGTACVRIEDAVITRLQEYTPENLEAYAELLRDFKALGDLEGLELEEGQLRMDFPMAEDSTLWMLLMTKMVAFAKAAHRVYPQRQQPEAEKYFMRGWLLRMGFGGSDFKAARQALLKNLKGCSAFPDAEKAKRHQERWAEIHRQHREARAERAEGAQEATEDACTVVEGRKTHD